jgi:threonyl-tRNA synthetase
LAKVPYLAVVGKRESEAGTLALRRHGGEDLGAVDAERLVEAFREATANKAVALELAGGDVNN